ncbi:MAG: type II toxin-antitoxin system VapC family toxin [Thermoguttaceae bacterium]|jgi:tRNA(fMet)-specific endonuclease VapC
MYLLDTDILSLLHLGHARVGRHKERVDPHRVVGTTIVTKVQILRARYDFVLKAADGEELLRAQHWLYRSESLLSQITIVPLSDDAATEFDRLRRDARLRKIGRADLLIACIALANRATLVTRNLRHFQQVPNLKLENWAD